MLEGLESRELLSFIGSEQQVNPNGNQYDFADTWAANASHPGTAGTSVVVWVNDYFGSGDRDIWAQRYNRYGARVGAPISVDFTGNDSIDPAVTMDSTGRFAVTWTNDNTDQVMQRQFNASGGALTGIQLVSGSAREPDVAAYNSAFVVTYTHTDAVDDTGIRARRTVWGGGPAAAVTINDTASDETHSSIAMAPNGRFNVAFQREFVEDDNDIYIRGYNPGGFGLRFQSTVDFSGLDDTIPDVSIDNAGSAIVAYQREFGAGDRDVHARRVNNDGVVGGLLAIADSTEDEYSPSIALAQVGGRYVATYYTWPTDAGVAVREFSPTGVLLATLGPVTANDPVGDFAGQYRPAISIDGFNRYMVTYTRFGGADQDIFVRRDLLT